MLWRGRLSGSVFTAHPQNDNIYLPIFAYVFICYAQNISKFYNTLKNCVWITTHTHPFCVLNRLLSWLVWQSMCAIFVRVWTKQSMTEAAAQKFVWNCGKHKKKIVWFRSHNYFFAFIRGFPEKYKFYIEAVQDLCSLKHTKKHQNSECVLAEGEKKTPEHRKTKNLKIV